MRPMTRDCIRVCAMDPSFLADFRDTVDRAVTRLLALSNDEAAARPAPGKWSAKEIIGHLVDSASNNHGRFVRAQLQDDLVFDGYEQADWVRVQVYQGREWAELVQLWQALNHHLTNVMESADPATLRRPRARHKLDALAWQPTEIGQPSSTSRDYVGHLK